MLGCARHGNACRIRLKINSSFSNVFPYSHSELLSVVLRASVAVNFQVFEGEVWDLVGISVEETKNITQFQ